MDAEGIGHPIEERMTQPLAPLWGRQSGRPGFSKYGVGH